jgi:cyanate lyase
LLAKQFDTMQKGQIMSQSQLTKDARLNLAERILQAKDQKELSFQELASETSLSLAFVTAALLGQHPLPTDAAAAVGKKLGLGKEDVTLLQAVPLRGSIPEGIPTDPTICRFYEIVHVYGTTLKALVHELFGDGIISAINFRMDIKKVEDPEGGSRAVITLDGKYLPTKPY